MAGRKETPQEVALRALKCVKNTTVDLKKIADYYGYTGKARKKFIEVAEGVRVKQYKEWGWDEQQ